MHEGAPGCRDTHISSPAGGGGFRDGLPTPPGRAEDSSPDPRPDPRPDRLATPEDARLVAALTMLSDQLPAIVDEVLAGQLDQNERRQLAQVLATIAADLNPALLLGLDRGV